MSSSTEPAPSFPKLTIGNWPSWQINMVARLRSRGLYTIMNKKRKRPTEPSEGDNVESAASERRTHALQAQRISE